MPTPAPPRRSGPRSPAPPSPRACWPSATASPPKPSANGASADLMTARTAPRDRTSCPGKQRKKSGPLSCALRRATGFPLDDLTFVVTHFLPHLNRDAVYRILKAEGL